jgi:hypothetical protein
MFENQLDEFLILNDRSDNKTILYNNRGQILIANCISVQTVKIIVDKKKVDQCYNEVPVSFQLNNNTVTAFLTSDGIIRTKPTTRICAEYKIITLPFVKKYIKLIFDKMVIVNTSNVGKVETIDDEEFLIKLNHAEEVIQDIDILDEIKNRETAAIVEETSIDETKLEASNEINTLSQGLVNMKDNIVKNSIKLLIYIVTILMVVIATVLTSLFCMYRSKTTKIINKPVIYKSAKSSKNLDSSKTHIDLDQINIVEEDAKLI